MNKIKLLFLIISFLIPCILNASGINGKKIVMVIAPENYRDEEFETPNKILKENGAVIKVASTTLNEVVGMLKESKVVPDILLKKVKVKNFDAIILVGGSGSTCYWDDQKTHDLLKEFNSNKKLIAAICLAPGTLAKAGLLKGKKATSYASAREILETQGAKYSESQVVKDGNIITGSGPEAVDEFAEAIVEYFE